jgi:uncharacterized protein (DUF2141 family)
MVKHKKYIGIYFFLVLLIGSVTIKAQNIEVLITGIRSTKGQLIIKIYQDNKSFQDDTPVLVKKLDKNGISDGQITFKISLGTGTYGFALLDDENNDNEMNYSFAGMPKEGFAFSNFYLSGLSRPDFDEFKFVVSKNQTQKILMKIRYM